MLQNLFQYFRINDRRVFFRQDVAADVPRSVGAPVFDVVDDQNLEDEEGGEHRGQAGIQNNRVSTEIDKSNYFVRQ